MADYARSLLDQTAVLAVEADLADWAEQHHSVHLPDDEYPHADTSGGALWAAQF